MKYACYHVAVYCQNEIWSKNQTMIDKQFKDPQLSGRFASEGTTECMI